MKNCLDMFSGEKRQLIGKHAPPIVKNACEALYGAALGNVKVQKLCMEAGLEDKIMKIRTFYEGKDLEVTNTAWMACAAINGKADTYKHINSIFPPSQSVGPAMSGSESGSRQPYSTISRNPSSAQQTSSTDHDENGAPSIGSRDRTSAERESGEVCAACGKTSADTGSQSLMRCSACTIAPRYCSVACQKACWECTRLSVERIRRRDRFVVLFSFDFNIMVCDSECRKACCWEAFMAVCVCVCVCVCGVHIKET
jgi:hypothetical protein